MTERTIHITVPALGIVNALRHAFERATSNTDEDQALYEQHNKLVSHDFTGNHWPGPWG